MTARLQGRVVAVTGAASGLGRAAALAMAREGARLTLTDIDGTQLSETVRLIREIGGEVVSVVGDVARESTHGAWVAATLDAYGRLDGLCNVAGVLGPGALADVTAERFDHILHVNCLGPLLAIKHAAPLLRPAGSAAIVNVASVGALVALPMMTMYCASKAAVLGMTRAVAADLAPEVRCNALCPGGIDTPMSQALLASVAREERGELLSKLTGRQLLKRFAAPEEIAQSIVFLISSESSFLTGAVIAADGGHSAS